MTRSNRISWLLLYNQTPLVIIVSTLTVKVKEVKKRPVSQEEVLCCNKMIAFRKHYHYITEGLKQSAIVTNSGNSENN
jgi:hypothetical protein